MPEMTVKIILGGFQTLAFFHLDFFAVILPSVLECVPRRLFFGAF